MNGWQIHLRATSWSPGFESQGFLRFKEQKSILFLSLESDKDKNKQKTAGKCKYLDKCHSRKVRFYRQQLSFIEKLFYDRQFYSRRLEVSIKGSLQHCLLLGMAFMKCFHTILTAHTACHTLSFKLSPIPIFTLYTLCGLVPV